MISYKEALERIIEDYTDVEISKESEPIFATNLMILDELKSIVSRLDWIRNDIIKFEKEDKISSKLDEVLQQLGRIADKD